VNNGFFCTWIKIIAEKQLYDNCPTIKVIIDLDTLDESAVQIHTQRTDDDFFEQR
jgi:hypothetical protein